MVGYGTNDTYFHDVADTQQAQYVVGCALPQYQAQMEDVLFLILTLTQEPKIWFRSCQSHYRSREIPASYSASFFVLSVSVWHLNFVNLDTIVNRRLTGLLVYES